jgi:hypothetical protein
MVAQKKKKKPDNQKRVFYSTLSYDLYYVIIIRSIGQEIDLRTKEDITMNDA